jgi:hypothetical protein
MQINYQTLFMWFLITIGGVIIFAVMYRLVSRSIPDRSYRGPTDISQLPLKYMFISADQANARTLLKRAREEIESGSFLEGLERSFDAVRDILLQLLRFYEVDGKDLDVDTMLQSLSKKGIILGSKDEYQELSKTYSRILAKEVFRKGEALYSLHLCSVLVERSKEAKITE